MTLAKDHLRRRWWQDGGPEGRMIAAIFSVLIVAGGLLLAFDLKTLLEKSSDTMEWGPLRELKIRISEPKPQEQPFDPHAAPFRIGRPSAMPGLPSPPTAEMINAPMAFYADKAGGASAIGRIDVGASARLAKFLSSETVPIQKLWLLSPGGSVSDAIDMGRLVRRQSIATTVGDGGYCASSCPLLFAGGVTREAAENAVLGVHQVTPDQSTPPSAEELGIIQAVAAECQEYLVAMGVDPRTWMKGMKTPKERLYVFTRSELSEFKIITQTLPKPVGQGAKASG